MSTQGPGLTAIMAGHDRGPEYALVQCTGENLTCSREQRVERSADQSEADLAARFNELGWSIRPTLCPEHNTESAEVPQPSVEDATIG